MSFGVFESAYVDDSQNDKKKKLAQTRLAQAVSAVDRAVGVYLKKSSSKSDFQDRIQLAADDIRSIVGRYLEGETGFQAVVAKLEPHYLKKTASEYLDPGDLNDRGAQNFFEQYADSAGIDTYGGDYDRIWDDIKESVDYDIISDDLDAAIQGGELSSSVGSRLQWDLEDFHGLGSGARFSSKKTSGRSRHTARQGDWEAFDDTGLEYWFDEEEGPEEQAMYVSPGGEYGWEHNNRGIVEREPLGTAGSVDEAREKALEEYGRFVGSRRSRGARREKTSGTVDKLKKSDPQKYNDFMETISPGVVFEPGELDTLYQQWDPENKLYSKRTSATYDDDGIEGFLQFIKDRGYSMPKDLGDPNSDNMQDEVWSFTKGDPGRMEEITRDLEDDWDYLRTSRRRPRKLVGSSYGDDQTGYSVEVENRGGSETGIVRDPNGQEVDTIHPLNGANFDGEYELQEGLEEFIQDLGDDAYQHRRDFHSKKKKAASDAWKYDTNFQHILIEMYGTTDVNDEMLIDALIAYAGIGAQQQVDLGEEAPPLEHVSHRMRKADRYEGPGSYDQILNPTENYFTQPARDGWSPFEEHPDYQGWVDRRKEMGLEPDDLYFDDEEKKNWQKFRDTIYEEHPYHPNNLTEKQRGQLWGEGPGGNPSKGFKFDGPSGSYNNFDYSIGEDGSTEISQGPTTLTEIQFDSPEQGQGFVTDFFEKGYSDNPEFDPNSPEFEDFDHDSFYDKMKSKYSRLSSRKSSHTRNRMRRAGGHKRVAGATDFGTFAKGSSAKDAFSKACREAIEMYGNQGYTGSIAEKDSFEMATNEVVSPDDIPSVVDQVFSRFEDKWGPAGCIELTTGEYFFFGVASE